MVSIEVRPMTANKYLKTLDLIFKRPKIDVWTLRRHNNRLVSES
jgi:hypothetical protein